MVQPEHRTKPPFLPLTQLPSSIDLQAAVAHSTNHPDGPFCTCADCHQSHHSLSHLTLNLPRVLNLPCPPPTRHHSLLLDAQPCPCVGPATHSAPTKASSVQPNHLTIITCTTFPQLVVPVFSCTPSPLLNKTHRKSSPLLATARSLVAHPPFSAGHPHPLTLHPPPSASKAQLLPLLTSHPPLSARQ